MMSHWALWKTWSFHELKNVLVHYIYQQSDKLKT